MPLDQIQNHISSGANEQLAVALKQSPEKARLTTSMGVSLVTFAAYYRNLEAIRTIRAYLDDVTIHEACCIGELETVKEQLHKAPEVLNSFSADGFTPLGLACFFGHVNLAAYLIETGADTNIAANNDFRVAPIHSACAIWSVPIVNLLIAAGANVNLSQQKGIRPIHSASHNGSLEIVRILIASGADHKIADDSGKTPTDYALEKNYDELVAYLKTLS
ncbi:ankyrin repeat domain-containing protein [uncultured Imperialibacter sp.]|uniref:ankyrin repeat domain-containing protein n=1 Tax=uncultured Imperialibacter sp. TaxID=1672639 RepID=UPI0030D8B481|tara:strand:+ start:32304 stop:32960 length:657 start_codon:yes stop_codon:yes gene_type:complete